MCGYVNNINTSQEHRSGERGPKAFDINTRVALGCLHAGIGQSHINNLLSTMNIPTMNSTIFKNKEREVGKAVEKIARASCQNSIERVREEAVRNGIECEEDNLIPVSCSFDMGWQKRGKGHNSLTGQAAVMSLSTGKILDYTTRVKTCRFCDHAKTNNKAVTEHDCRRNHSDSSKSMEPAAAVEMFSNAPKHNIKYSVYTGDDDSTTEAHIRQKVSYKVDKLSDIIHTKRSLTTRLYNLKETARFPNSSTLSKKVINYLVKCFSYAIAQNKGNPQGILSTIKCIVPHAFGNHTDCSIGWCGYKDDPLTYKHKMLPYGRDLFGEKLKSSLEAIFNDYCTETVATKLAPFTNSQRNEALNSVIGSKNPKIRFYGGSESSDFRVACGVAQTNLRYAYIDRTLEALNIEPGFFCTKYNDSMTAKVNRDKIRKSNTNFKKQRALKHLNSCLQTARKESKEGTTYQTGVGLNLSVENISKNDEMLEIQGRVLAMQPNKFKEIENSVSPYTPRPQRKQIKFDHSKSYNFLVFDIETNSASSKSAEICQLSAIDYSGSYTFSEYILPTDDIDVHASAVNKLTIKNINGERKLFKNGVVVPAMPLNEVITRFTRYISQSIDRAKSTTNKDITTVLIGHNIARFDTPILLRNAGKQFSDKLQSMEVCFADSLALFKTLVKCKFPSLKNSDGIFPQVNQSSLYETLFQQSFDAHDALEDVTALRKILFSSRLELPAKTIIDNSRLVDTNHAINDMEYLDRRHRNVQTFNYTLYNPQNNTGCLIKKNMIEKISGSGLTYEDLQNVHKVHGKDGLTAILSKPPSRSSSSKPRVTRTGRILSAIVEHFANIAINRSQ